MARGALRPSLIVGAALIAGLGGPTRRGAALPQRRVTRKGRGMDGQRFDAFVRRVASGRSRRDVLKLLGVGVLGGVGLRSQTAEAACQAKNAACTSDDECCSGTCNGSG